MKKLTLLFALIISFITAGAQTDSLTRYTGKYKFPDGSAVPDITVSIENGMLVGSSAQGSSEFKPTSTADVFEIVAFGGTATFRRKEGKIVGVYIEVGDIRMEGVKEE